MGQTQFVVVVQCCASLALNTAVCVWDVTVCRWAGVRRRFEGTWCLSFQQMRGYSKLSMLVFEILTRSAGNILLVRGKAGPLQPWTGPEGSRWLRLPDFKTVGT